MLNKKVYMSEDTGDFLSAQADMFEDEDARSLLDQLFVDSRLYSKSQDFMELLDFVVRLRNFAPFNAMLLQVQKPGLSYAASERDWFERFGRKIKEGARPLIILWPFGPVALVYDVLDTVGKPLPEDVYSFPAKGFIDAGKIKVFAKLLENKNIRWVWTDAGDNKAGSIQVVKRATSKESKTAYLIKINRNHESANQFVTLTHELGHLFLGHLGADKKLGIPKRQIPEHDLREIEAESVAYLVSRRNGIVPKSQTYS
ncbi:MAG: ImmA/IrrE family metallo-endopeptidase [gamma proteobacterium endosymbiont of Lamellibrachia anaximandri]|nr:ImmA/IrrE family metallo-endopeptidase [gamma proteobacterium endosymbiont of Lamellibrachia anaximandri]MBL3535363.1 ImmA/IrrE family metallo-endopeptidase [gamma proteobacterium endosymbiont of Lamellibrachia anaximandri]